MRPERARRDSRPAVALLQSGLIGIAAVAVGVLCVAAVALLVSVIVAANY